MSPSSTPHSPSHVPLCDNDAVIQKECMNLLHQMFPHTAASGNIIISPCSGGITNRLVRADLPDGSIVLIRVYGRKTEVLVDRQAELRTIRLLAEKGLAGQLYGTFENGFVYEFVEGTVLTHLDLPLYSGQIAAELATWHDIIGEIGMKEPCLIPTLKRWLHTSQDLYSGKFPIPGWSFERISKMISMLAIRVTSHPIAFCHNDLLASNIIVSGEDRVRFIDFEYAGPNYASFDLANHFCEWAGFECDWSALPDEKDKRKFVDAYISCRKTLAGLNADNLLKFIEEMKHAPHLFWALWALIQARHSDINFDYLVYAQLRLAQIV